jgi:tetratricopeptide (TPR) repeat protein/predicted Ser/Thr protein kinase
MSADTQPSAAPQNPEDAQHTRTVGVPSPASDTAERQLPATIGRYRILRLLGEGGMGAVYEAEQEQPRRTVALKVIKAAWASPEIIRRFEKESQALGRLHHPGIAQIYEAGTADTGFGLQPFFAMELIHGKPLGEYADAQRLSTRQRLALMIQVCEAVQHAHQRGIIHRDLKPGNILVDENGQPKILDFGLARVTDSDAHATRQTDMGQLLGTLAYMSPEQVLADPQAVDTRSDVYALGVILYELLAGKLPYTLTHHLFEVVQTIREQDPAPLRTVSRVYRGDIESIVAKALEKDKGRRYSSAADFAADIRRYLEDEPILAKRPSTRYQLQKFARRHKALVAGVAAVFVVLVAGVVASTLEAARARTAERSALAAQQAATRDRDRAVTAERQAEQDRNRARASEARALQDRNLALELKKRADTEAATADAVNGFLQNDLLAQASANNQSGPTAKPDPDLKVRTALDRAAERITGKFNQQPEVEAAIRDTMGQTYTDLGLYPEARKQLERALDLYRRVLGAENPKTLGTMHRLGYTAQLQGKYPEAEALYSQMLQIARRVLSPEHPDVLRAMNGLASIYYLQHKSAQAAALYSQTLEVRRRVLGPEHPDTLRSITGLASAYYSQGKYAQAAALFSQTLEARRRVLGPEHPDTLTAMNNLANTYHAEAKYAEAEVLYNQTLEIRRRVLGPEHPDTLYSMISLADIYLTQRKYAEAEALFSQILEIERRVSGPEHPDTLLAMNGLGATYDGQGKYAEAEALFSQTVEIMRRVLGPAHPFTLTATNNLREMYQKQGKYAQAEALQSQILEFSRRVLGPEHPDTLTAMNNLGDIYQEQGKYAQAEALYSQALETSRRVLGPEHPDTLNSMSKMAGLHQDQGKYPQAEALYSQILEIRRRVLGPDHPDTLRSINDLASVYCSQGKFAESETLGREAAEIGRKKRPDDWQRFRAESLLGASLAGQKKYSEAEPLLLEGYQGMAARKDRIEVADWYLLDRALDWIVQFYADWGKPEKTAEWQQRILAQKSALGKQQ